MRLNEPGKTSLLLPRQTHSISPGRTGRNLSELLVDLRRKKQEARRNGELLKESRPSVLLSSSLPLPSCVAYLNVVLLVWLILVVIVTDVFLSLPSLVLEHLGLGWERLGLLWKDLSNEKAKSEVISSSSCLFSFLLQSRYQLHSWIHTKS